MVRSANFELSVDGVPRSYRDRKDLALQSAQILKSRNPNSVVRLKDLQTGKRSSSPSSRGNNNGCPSNSARPASAPGSTRTDLTTRSLPASGRSAASTKRAAVPTVSAGSGR